MLKTGPVVAVTPRGPLKYDTLALALASAYVKLEDPIFSATWPLDQTYLRGEAYATFPAWSGTPWEWLIANAQEPPPEPEKKVRVKRE